MRDREDFYFRYHRESIGSKNVFKVYSSVPFNEVRKYDYLKDDLIDGDIIEHRLSNVMDSADPRIYSVVKSYNGRAYAVSFNDKYNSKSIIRYDNLESEDFIDTKVIPIEELSDDYVTVTSNDVTNGFNGPTNPKYKPFDRCSNFISVDYPMYEIKEMYLVVMRIVAYYYGVRKNGLKALIVTSDRKFLDEIDAYSCSLFNRNRFNHSVYSFNRTSEYINDAEGIILCNNEIAQEYRDHGYEVLSFDKQINKDKEKVRGRKKR